MIKPKGLKLGATLGIIAPSSPTTRENVEKAYYRLTKLGFNIKIGESCYEKYGYLAGSDDLRANDINQMFKNPEIHGIICLRGGYGSPRILDLLDYDLIKKNPKVFIGYSDITALHIAINQISNLTTFHGPMATSKVMENLDDFTKDSLYNFIFENGFTTDTIKNPIYQQIGSINGGVVEAPLIGGNLSLITSTLGTPYEIQTKGKILFIEEIGEEPYRIDRMLTQLKLSNKLKEAEGIILGDFNNCVSKNGEPEDSLSLDEVIEDIIEPLKKPTLYNLKSGHCSPMITLPLGIPIRLDGNKKGLRVLDKPTV